MVMQGRDRHLGRFAKALLAAGLASNVVLSSGAAASGETGIFGWIEIHASPQKANHITIKGFARSLRSAEGKFRLVINRTNGGNQSKSQQTGTFKTDHNDAQPLSKTTINVTPSDRLKFELFLSMGGKDVFSAVLRTMAD